MSTYKELIGSWFKPAENLYLIFDVVPPETKNGWIRVSFLHEDGHLVLGICYTEDEMNHFFTNHDWTLIL